MRTSRDSVVNKCNPTQVSRGCPNTLAGGQISSEAMLPVISHSKI